MSPVPSGWSKRNPVPWPVAGVARLDGVDEPAGGAHDRAPSRSAGCTSASGRRARSATASGTCPPPPRSCGRARCRRRGARAKRSGAARGQGAKPSWTSGSPVPSTTMRSGRCRRSYQAFTTMSKPFWCDEPRDDPDQRAGPAPPGGRRPRSTSALHAALPDRSSARVASAAMWRSRARVPLVVVHAVQDPHQVRRRASARRASKP